MWCILCCSMFCLWFSHYQIIRMKFPNLSTRRLGTRGQSKYVPSVTLFTSGMIMCAHKCRQYLLHMLCWQIISKFYEFVKSMYTLHRLIPKSFLQPSSLKFSSTKSAPCIYIPTMGLDICVLWSTWLSPPSLAQVPLLRSVYQRDLDLLPFSLLQERSHKVYNCNKCH